MLGPRFLTFTARRQMTVLGRDGSFVAGASWPGARRELDAGIEASSDGKLFAFRVSNAQAGRSGAEGVVYVVRAGAHQAQAVYRRRLGPVGCGWGANLSWHGSSLLYRTTDALGVTEAAVLTADGSSTRLSPLLVALPRIRPDAPADAFWATELLP